MDKLTKIIGLAPSELSQEAFAQRLSKERERVVREIQLYRSKRNAPRKKRGAPKKAARELGKLLAASGVTPEQLQLKIKERMEKRADS